MSAAPSASFPFKGSDNQAYQNQTLPIDGSGNVPMSAGGVQASTAARQDAILGALAVLATDADLLAVVNKTESVRALLAAALTINLPAGASTAALQSTGNSALANILTALSTLSTDADTQATTAKVEAVRALLAAVLTIQGTVTANLGTLNGAALDATVSALGAKLDTLHTDSGTTLHADLGALLTKLGTTLAVSLASAPLPTGAATSAKQPALGTAGTPSTDVLTVQNPANQALGVDTVVKGTAATNRSGTIAVGGTAQVLAVANAGRRGFRIQNQSTGALYWSLTGTATLDQNSFLLNAGDYFETPSHFAGGSTISIIGATTGQQFHAAEF